MATESQCLIGAQQTETMAEISSLDDIRRLAMSGCADWKTYGDVSVEQDGALLIFNYNRECQYARRWNFFERVSRGLIIDRATGEVIARPFDKFFNWCEVDPKPPWKPKHITEKVDGSLGILYRQAGQYLIATRGSFHSDQAMWATEWLRKNKPTFRAPDSVTFLFEIVYPENRVVVDYHGRSDLVLLAVRDRFTGKYWPPSAVHDIADFYHFRVPQVHRFDSLDALTTRCEALGGDAEGFVVEFENGDRYKFKGTEYLRLHRLICGMSFKVTLEAIANGTAEEYRSELPEEFRGQFDVWATRIHDTVQQITAETERLFAEAPKGSRKEFALWAKANAKDMAPYLFQRMDDRPLESVIWRALLREEHCYST